MMSRIAESRIVILGALTGCAILFSRAPAAAADPAGTAQAARSASHSALNQTLDKPASLHFKETPLDEAAARVARDFKITILLDRKALAEAGIADRTPVSFDLEGAPLETALRQMLAKLDLDCITLDNEENAIEITSAALVRARPYTRMYNVREFAPSAKGFVDPVVDWNEISDMVSGAIAPTTWNGSGGSGVANCFAGNLFVSQTRDVHQQIADLFEALETARQRRQIAPGQLVHPLPGPLPTREREKKTDAAPSTDVSTDAFAPIRIGGVADEKIRRLLQNRVDLHFANVPLRDVAKFVREQGIPVLIDHANLEKGGVKDDRPLSFDAKQVRLGWGLARMLAEADLEYVVNDGTVLIMSDAAAKQRVYCVVYPVGDLIDTQREQTGDDPDEALDELVKTIIGTVAPPSWEGGGGAGRLTRVTAARALFCAQTADVQEEIARLLARIREQPKTPNPAVAGSSGHNGEPVVKLYRLVQPEPTGGRLPQQSVDTIKKLLGPEIWRRDGTYIQAFPSSIVVRQTPEVQHRIKRLLDELGAIKEPAAKTAPGNAPGGKNPSLPPASSFRGGGFGGGGSGGGGFGGGKL